MAGATDAPRRVWGARLLGAFFDAQLGCIPIALIAIGLIVVFFQTVEHGAIVVTETLFVGIGLWIRGGASKLLNSLSTSLLILASGAAPHLLFVLSFDQLASHDFGPEGFVRVAHPEPHLVGEMRLYEAMAVWLHDHLAWLLAFPKGLLAIVGAVALGVAALTGRVRFLERLATYRKWTGRVTLLLVGATAFTVFAANPSGQWSPDLRERVQAHWRDKERAEIRQQLARSIEHEAMARPQLFIANAKAAAMSAYQPNASFGSNVEEASLEEIAERYVGRIKPHVPTIDADQPKPAEIGFALPARVTVEQAESSSVEAKQAEAVASQIEESVKSRLTELIPTDTIHRELARVFVGKLVDAAVDAGADRVMQRLRDRYGGRLAGTLPIDLLPSFTKAVVIQLLTGRLDERVSPADRADIVAYQTRVEARKEQEKAEARRAEIERVSRPRMEVR